MNPAPERITELLEPYIPSASVELVLKVSAYLDLLLRWNARTNLTSIRDPEHILTRHFGESLFAATVLAPHLPQEATLLDFGSGAGFPGIPIQLVRPDLRVTLAESQRKKAAFLSEVVRTLRLPTAVHAARASTLPAGAFDCVTLRAVDRMEVATVEALLHLQPKGILALMTTAFTEPPVAISGLATHPIPQAEHSVIALFRSA